MNIETMVDEAAAKLKAASTPEAEVLYAVIAIAPSGQVECATNLTCGQLVKVAESLVGNEKR